MSNLIPSSTHWGGYFELKSIYGGGLWHMLVDHDLTISTRIIAYFGQGSFVSY